MVETAKRSNLVLLYRHAQATACGHGCDVLRPVFRSDHNLIYCNRAIDFGLLHCPSRFQHTIHHSSASRRRLDEITLQVSFVPQSGRRTVVVEHRTDGGEWRTGRDSNPRYASTAYGGLANRWFQPLTHLSERCPPRATRALLTIAPGSADLAERIARTRQSCQSVRRRAALGPDAGLAANKPLCREVAVTASSPCH